MNHIANLERQSKESSFKGKINIAVNRMLDCMLNNSDKSCKKCDDISVCGFLMDAVFAYRNKEVAKSSV